ncbi:MAG: phosphorylase [Nitrospirae bacterium]|nr:phosphorylase [Nitrospirota bacterium]
MLEKGTLWQQMLRTTEHALKSGALRSFPTNQVFIEDGGVRFFVRVLKTLEEKAAARVQQDKNAGAGRNANPFSPPEKELTVADVTDTHIAVLNKYNVMDHHLLIVTRHFEDQETLLTLRDFEALWLCMAEYDGLGFYNGGREAGASQPHKHLQIVPLPLTPERPRIPVEPLLNASGPMSVPGPLPVLPFRHSFVRLRYDMLEKPREAALESFDLYSAMLGSVGMGTPGAAILPRQSMPYCLLVTRQWMLLVPRSREHFEDISLNALAFAGSFYVANKLQLQRLRSFGPFNALKAVTLPSDR